LFELQLFKKLLQSFATEKPAFIAFLQPKSSLQKLAICFSFGFHSPDAPRKLKQTCPKEAGFPTEKACNSFFEKLQLKQIGL
jgi:hypothetical protein